MTDILSINLQVAQQVARLPRQEGTLRRRMERMKASCSFSIRRINEAAGERVTPGAGPGLPWWHQPLAGR